MIRNNIIGRQSYSALSLWLVLITGLLSFHFVLIPWFLRGTGYAATYAPVAVPQADSVFTHIPIVGKLLSGLPAFSDQFVISDANQHISVWPRVPYYVLALLGWSVADHLEALAVVSTVLLAPLNTAVLYILIVRISGSKTCGVLASTVVMGFREVFVLQPWHWVNLDEMADILSTPIFSNAMVHPQISFLLLCCSLITLHQLTRRPGRLISAIHGLIYGLSFYTYIYLWTYLTGLYFVVGTYFVLKGDRKILASLLQSVVLGLVVSVVYWFDAVRLWEQPGFADFQDRFSLGRLPDLEERFVNLRPHLVTLIGIGLMVAKRHYGYTLLFLMTMTAELFWKLPIVIGHDYQSLHYAYHIFSACAGITCVIAAIETMSRFRLINRGTLRLSLSYWITACLLLLIAYRSVTYSIKNYSAYALGSDIEGAYEYIRFNAKPGDVVLAADPEVNMRVRSIAPVYVYVPSGYGTFVTTEEMLERTAEMMHVFGITSQQMLDYQEGDGTSEAIPSVRGLIIPESYLFNGSLKYPTLETRGQAIKDAYRLRNVGSVTYSVDLIWVGPYERALGKTSFEDKSGVELIYSNDSVSLYQVTSRDALRWQ